MSNFVKAPLLIFHIFYPFLIISLNSRIIKLKLRKLRNFTGRLELYKKKQQQKKHLFLNLFYTNKQYLT